MARPSGLLMAALIVALAIAGCGKKSVAGDSAAATAKGFAAALASGDFAGAASAYDYTDYARKQFEDWDSLPSSQRELITRKTAEAKADELKAVAQRLGSGIKVGGTQGETATIGGSGGSVSIQMAQRDGKWLITELW
jgi:hypothetical protein